MMTSTVLLLGNPNAGKSTLFNALSGGTARVGNYPGITVDRQSAHISIGDQACELVDLPGAYSLSAQSPEEALAMEVALGGEADVVVCVVDVTAFTRGMYLALQLVEAGVPTVVALNMVDSLGTGTAAGLDVEVIERELGARVVPMSASRREGIDALRAAIAQTLKDGPPSAPAPAYSSALLEDIQTLAPVVQAWLGGADDAAVRSRSLWCLLSLGDDDRLQIPASVREAVAAVRRRAGAAGRDLEVEIIGARYALLDRIKDAAARDTTSKQRALSERVDGVLTHPVAGLIAFALVMYVIFEALFAWSEPLIEAIEIAIAFAQDHVIDLLAAGSLRDLLVYGVIAGVGNVLVFVPQILLLFLFIGFLEDSGYLARVAFVIDRVMAGVGLHGRAFVPLLSGFACAVPAVMATRTIDNRRDRLITMLALPLMSCSARLPVYVLVTATVFAGTSRVFGVFSAGALALFCMYALSVVFTLSAAAVMRRTVLRGPRAGLVLELPPYRMPISLNLWLGAWRRLKTFLVDAGTIILALTIVLWGLLAFPKDPQAERVFEEQSASAAVVTDDTEREALLNQAELTLDAANIRHSIGGQAGRLLEPVLAPLGFDWRIGIGIIGAFAAREVFISTLAIVFGIEEGGDDGGSLRVALGNATWPDGSPLMTPLVGVSLMVFFLLACQCMSTIAVVRRESGGWKWPLFMFGYMTVLAYVASLLVFQVGRLLGFG